MVLLSKVLAFLFVVTFAHHVEAFNQRRAVRVSRLRLLAGANPGKQAVWNGSNGENNSLLDEFKTASGDVVNPYAVLNVPREAERQEIRQSYLALSKRYHPDGVKHKEILPGNCNDMDDVREQWERIKLAYEILTDRRARKRYDRHEAIVDPGAAVSRAAMGVVAKGFSGLGKGLFSAGSFAINQLTKEAESAYQGKDEDEKVAEQS